MQRGRLNGKRLFLFFVGIFALYALCFSPALRGSYAHLDGFRHFYLDKSNKTECNQDPQYSWIMSMGRPLAAQFECVIFRHVSRVSDMTPFRWGAVVSLALSALLLAVLLHWEGAAWPLSFLISVPIFLLPGAYVIVNVVGDTLSFALFFSLLGYLFFFLRGKTSSTEVRKVYSSLTVLALTVSFLFYASLTFIFLIPLGASLLLSRPAEVKEALKKTQVGALFLVGSAILYFLFCKVILHLGTSNEITYAFNVNPKSTIQFLLPVLDAAVAKAVMLWIPWNQFFPTALVGLFLGAFAVMGIAMKYNNSSKTIPVAFCLMMLFCLTPLPLYASKNAAFVVLHRTMFCGVAFVWMTLCLSAFLLVEKSQHKTMYGILAGVAALGITVTTLKLGRTVENSKYELSFLKQKLSKLAEGNYSYLKYRVPAKMAGRSYFCETSEGDEFLHYSFRADNFTWQYAYSAYRELNNPKAISFSECPFSDADCQRNPATESMIRVSGTSGKTFLIDMAEAVKGNCLN